ncbi:MAG TPA: crossover junction endodeoxyribonuclease RuvC, partial [Candidatus Hydrogenedentes bacterium]|nr:crossover junction endodeoxyribonuclease RuvC [Candidatus Hydrogenedentota bacterium]
MRVLGFDPGTATTGYGVVDGQGNRLRHVAHGAITTQADRTFSERLYAIYEETARLLDTYSPDAVAIEKLFFSRNVTTALKVAQARGVIALAAEQRRCPIGEFSPL